MLTLCRILLLCLLSVLFQVPTLAQNVPDANTPVAIDYDTAYLSRNATAIRITEPITLDGLLDESVWNVPPGATDFVQRQPVAGAVPTFRTEARFLYDDDNLYVGVIAFDSEPDRMTINDITDDFNFRGTDVVGLVLDTLRDRRSGFAFVVNPGGGRYDGQIVNNGQPNIDWDGVWDFQVTRNDDGWVVEFQIPFNTLRFSNASSQEWGLNILRTVRRINDESAWSPIPQRFQVTRVSMAGTLRGIENIRPGRNLKVKPFAIAGFTQTRSGGNPFGDWVTDQDYDGGVDVKYGLTQSLTLDATYRTDFAQVEVDQQQVNLTRFNLFFPEKREFFLENAGTFNLGGGQGRSFRNDLVPFFSRRIGLSAQGTPIPIVGGARVTGQVGRYDVGFLTMKTESTGSTASNTYTVGRVKQNLLRNSWVGGIVTNRDSTVAGDYNRLFGVDAFFQFSNRLSFDAYVLKTDTPGLEGKDQARKFAAGWRDEELVIAGAYDTIQTNFNPEVGFVRRPNTTKYTGEFSFNPLIRSSRSVRNLIFGTTLEYFEDGTTEQVETRTQNLNLGIRFQNGASINYTLTERFERLNRVFRIRPGILIPERDYAYRRQRVSASSASSRKISGGGSVEWGKFWDGESESFTANLSVKPNYRVNVDVNYARNQADLAGGSFTTNLFGLRFVYAFNARTFFNAFLQYNAERNEVSSNIRFNIIHRPLSDLFVVYNDRRSTANAQVVERALIVKFTNLFDF